MTLRTVAAAWWRGEGPGRSTAWSLGGALLLFTAAAALLTWPQAIRLGSHAAPHHDVYFNLWRLTWMAHALRTAPATFFDGNVFYPEVRTLTFSDAMPIEGLVAAPMLWAGMPRVLVHNLVLLGGIIGSAMGMFVLVRRLTANATAAVVAGLVFAFAPFRFDHYMHMELQWAMWMPLAFWAMHRTLDSGRWLHGLQTGGFVVLQMLSSVYYGIFLVTVLTLGGGLLLLGLPRGQALRAGRALAAGGALAALLCGVYAQPYLATKKTVGERPRGEILRYSARPSDYLQATPDNYLYGDGDADLGLSERRMFPGIVPLALAIVGLVLVPSRPALVYLAVLIAAFDLSLGIRGYSYTFLYEHLALFGGLRAPARYGILVLMSLGVLAGHGVAALTRSLRAPARGILAVLLPCALLLEYRVSPLELVRYDNVTPPIYALLAALPPGVVAEFPMPTRTNLPGPDAFYTYMSSFHWRPLVNGYSGFYPASYLRRLDRLQRFPEAATLDAMGREGVEYVIVHPSLYAAGEGAAIVSAIQQQGRLRYLGNFSDGQDMAIAFQLQRQ